MTEALLCGQYLSAGQHLIFHAVYGLPASSQAYDVSAAALRDLMCCRWCCDGACSLGLPGFYSRLWGFSLASVEKFTGRRQSFTMG